MGSGGSRMRALLRRLGDERGITLVELLTTMVIMVFVITALVQMMTSGTNAENDLNRRFQAQQEARLGLDSLRRDVHNACGATVTSSSVQLMGVSPAPSFTCNVPVANWCASGSGQRFGLYRQAGAAACGTGLQRADYVISAAVFSPLATSVGQLPRLPISLTVNPEPSITRLNYTLTDAIALRNAGRG
jgi:Tfp pilus assembly protein PilW